MTECCILTFSYTETAAFLAGSLPEQLANRSVMQRSTINFNRFFAVKTAAMRVLYPIFIGVNEIAMNFSTGFVIGWFFLCLLAVSHTLCKYLISVLTFFHSVDKLMFHRSKGSRFF